MQEKEKEKEMADAEKEMADAEEPTVQVTQKTRGRGSRKARGVKRGKAAEQEDQGAGSGGGKPTKKHAQDKDRTAQDVLNLKKFLETPVDVRLLSDPELDYAARNITRTNIDRIKEAFVYSIMSTAVVVVDDNSALWKKEVGKPMAACTEEERAQLKTKFKELLTKASRDVSAAKKGIGMKVTSIMQVTPAAVTSELHPPMTSPAPLKPF